MRIAILTAALAASIFATVPATAQYNGGGANQDYRDDGRGDGRGDDRGDRRGDDRRGDGRRNDNRFAGGNRDWRQYRNYDYNRVENGRRGYFADNYYRDGRYYQERRLGRNDRIYRGSNGRYYCRRNDGTTGLILGGVAGGLLGNSLSYGRSSTLATLLGAGGGALLGQSIDRGNVRCR